MFVMRRMPMRGMESLKQRDRSNCLLAALIDASSSTLSRSLGMAAAEVSRPLRESQFTVKTRHIKALFKA